MQDASAQQQTKQKYKPNHQLTGLPFTQPCPSEEKQTKTQHKSHSIAYTNHWTNLRRAETKRKKEFSLETWEEETSNTISLKKNNEKAEKYCTNEGTRNTEVQINEEEIKLSEKEFRIMIVKMIKTLKIK